MRGGVFYGAFFDLGDARGNRDHDTRGDAQGVVVHLPDKVAQHLLGDVEIGDHTVLHGADSGDVAGGAPEHLFGFFADGADLTGDGVQGHHAGLAEDDALVLDVNERVGGA